MPLTWISLNKFWIYWIVETWNQNKFVWNGKEKSLGLFRKYEARFVTFVLKCGHVCNSSVCEIESLIFKIDYFFGIIWWHDNLVKLTHLVLQPLWKERGREVLNNICPHLAWMSLNVVAVFWNGIKPAVFVTYHVCICPSMQVKWFLVGSSLGL